jgi:uncharacterized protein YbjT (DUF2867 family)
MSVDLAIGYVRAIQDSRVKNVLFLSSYGAHRLDDAGPISGTGLAERILNSLQGVNVLHLRPGYFYTNLLMLVPMIRDHGYMGSIFEVPRGTFTLVHPTDIARIAADALGALSFEGHSFVYVVSDISGTDEIAAVIGAAIGKPDLKWVKIPTEPFSASLQKAGFTSGASAAFVEMFESLDRGVLFEDFVASGQKADGMSLEAFAQQFAAIYDS